MSKSEGPGPINELKEWQEKQYTPWKYAQEGKAPPFVKAGGNQKRAAAFFFALGAVSACFAALEALNGPDRAGDWPGLAVSAVLTVLFFYGGEQRSEKVEERQRSEKERRRPQAPVKAGPVSGPVSVCRRIP